MNLESCIKSSAATSGNPNLVVEPTPVEKYAQVKLDHFLPKGSGVNIKMFETFHHLDWL